MRILRTATFVALTLLVTRPASAVPFNPDPEIGIAGGDGFSTLLSDALQGISPENRACDGSGTLRCWDLINDVVPQLTAISGFFVNPDCSGPGDPDFVRDCLLSLHPSSEFDTLQTYYDDNFSFLDFTLSDSRGMFLPGLPGCSSGDEEEGDETEGESNCPPVVHFQIFGIPFPAGASLTITSINTISNPIPIPEPATLTLLAAGMGALVARRRLSRRGRR